MMEDMVNSGIVSIKIVYKLTFLICIILLFTTKIFAFPIPDYKTDPPGVSH